MEKRIHINQLNSYSHFTQSEIKHMLPYYQQNTIDNLFTIIQFYISHAYPQRHTVFCLDETLTNPVNKHPLYTHVQTVYCENCDGEQDRLLKTMNLATMLINYIYSFSGQDQDGDFRPIGNQPYSDYVHKKQILTIETNQISKQKSQYSTHPQKINGVRLISYNFIRNGTEIIINLGTNQCREDSIGILLATVRNWNLGRLGITEKLLDRYTLERLDKITQSLFIQGRAFLRKNNQVSDDYNSYSSNLNKLIQRVSQWVNNHTNASEQAFQEIIRQTINISKLKESATLAHTLKLIKIQIITKATLSQSSICKVIIESVTEWLMQAPINVSCSYSSFLHHEPINGQTTMWLSLYYLKEQLSTLQHKFLTKQDSIQFCHKIQRLLIDQKAQNFKSSTPIQQNMNKSFALLSKYKQKQSQMINHEPKMLNQTHLHPNKSDIDLNQSFVSYASNSIQRQKKINMKRIAKIENSIYEILRELETNQPVLSPSELEDKIDAHCRYLQKKYQQWQMTQSLNTKQYLMFESLWSVVEQLTSEDMNSLMKQNPSEIDYLLNILMQTHNYDKMITLGKIIGLENLQTLFRSSLQTGLRRHRSSILIIFLKKMIENYCITSSQEYWKPLLLQSISIPELLHLLQTKSYDQSPSYAAIVKVIVPQLFHNDSNMHPVLNSTTTNHIKIISPLLYLYHEHLLRQNHPDELVHSFIGEILFEAVYYWKQAAMAKMLTNSPYTQSGYENSQISLKEKKVMEIIREGGFQGHGYEIKMLTYPIISAHKGHRIRTDSCVYDLMRISRSVDALKFFKLLGGSHINEKIIRFGWFYRKHQFFEEELKKSRRLICFLLKRRNIPELFPEQSYHQIANEQQEKQQYESISRRILASQSGIFQDMARLNPALKIAGVEIKSAIRELAATRKQIEEEDSKKRGIIEAERAKQAFVTEQVKCNYELVQLTSNLKAKYVDYHLLSEQEKVYFRECAENVIAAKEKIYQYLGLSSEINQLCTDTY